MSPHRAVVDDVARTFLATKGTAVTDSDRCRDLCDVISREFVDLVLAEGVTAKVVDGVELGSLPNAPETRLVLNGHYAALVCLGDPETSGPDADVVWDWTARQFDPAAPCPLIQPLSVWREKWQTMPTKILPSGHSPGRRDHRTREPRGLPSLGGRGKRCQDDPLVW